MFMYVCACASVCVAVCLCVGIYVCGAYGGQKKALDSQELEYQQL